MRYHINVDRLKEKREQKGWNKLVASQEMGIHQSVYSRYESGERTPTYQVIRTMAQYLGTSAEYLTGQTNDPKPVEMLITSEDSRLSFIVESYNRFSDTNKKAIYEYVMKLSKSKSSQNCEL